MNGNVRRQLLVIGRVVISLGLVAYLLSRVDLPALLALWRGLALPLLLLAFGLLIAGVFISSFKWWLLLRASQHDVSYGWAVRTYFIGTFFSNFLPTMVGGDAVRMYLLQQRTGRTGDAVASVFVERITGFLALTVIAATALLLSFDTLRPAPSVFWAALWCVVIAAGGLTLAFSAPLVVRLLTRLHIPNVLNWQGKLVRIGDTLSRYYTYHRTLALVIALSFGYQLSWIAANYAAARSLGLAVPFSMAALMVPVSDIVGLVPIFFNSLGAREGTFILLLGLIGIGSAAAIGLSLLIFVLRLVVSLIGGLIYLGSGSRGTRFRDDMQTVERPRLAEEA